MKISKNVFIFLLIIFLSSISLNLSTLFKNLNSYFLKKSNRVEVIVKKIIDGDTVDTSDGERLRLYEINAPEYPKDCLGVDARARMEELVFNKKILYEKFGKDNFGRTLAYVFVDKLLINEVMTEEGNYRQADNTRIYHTPDCYNYDKITIKPGTTDRWFCNEDEAKKLGFVKSKDCPK